MFVVKEIIYGLDQETWEDRICSFKTEEEAQLFVEDYYNSDYFVEEEEE